MRALLILSTALALTACGDTAPAASPAPKAVAKGGEFAGTPPLDAAGVPRLRPGLYEVVQVDNDEAPQTTRECVGEEANAEMRRILTQKPTPDCKLSRTTGPAGLQVQSECRQNGMTNRLKLTVAGADTAYRMTLAISVTTPDGETSTTESVAQGRWLGACPAGLAPGQTLED
jgi:hypothetical protein